MTIAWCKHWDGAWTDPNLDGLAAAVIARTSLLARMGLGPLIADPFGRPYTEEEIVRAMRLECPACGSTDLALHGLIRCIDAGVIVDLGGRGFSYKPPSWARYQRTSRDRMADLRARQGALPLASLQFTSDAQVTSLRDQIFKFNSGSLETSHFPKRDAEDERARLQREHEEAEVARASLRRKLGLG